MEESGAMGKSSIAKSDGWSGGLVAILEMGGWVGDDYDLHLILLIFCLRGG